MKRLFTVIFLNIKPVGVSFVAKDMHRKGLIADVQTRSLGYTSLDDIFLSMPEKGT